MSAQLADDLENSKDLSVYEISSNKSGHDDQEEQGTGLLEADLEVNEMNFNLIKNSKTFKANLRQNSHG